jgi:TolB-like protein/Tfp pilus assembly protein PilF
MNFFDELKRRNVFRVGIAYGIAAWFVLQVADLVLENIEAPHWVIQTLMLFVGLGFVAALIIAWAYELTPEGIKREADVVRDESITHQTARKLNSITLIAVFVLLGFMVLDRFVFERRSVPVSSPETVQAISGEKGEVKPGPGPEAGEKSIAVLPFVDMSAEGDQAYFADGIAEEILNVLVKTHSLKVAGRTSSFQFRGRNEDLRLIGEQLGVEHILEGSIRKSKNRLRITAQLVKANDGFHLWSETYDRDLIDIFAIQDEIARAITDALAIELNLGSGDSSLAQVKTTNMEAYDRYLEAKGLIAERNDFPRMIRLLEEATELDPGFADGWATLAQATALTFYYDVEERETALRAAEPYARRAIELDSGSSAAHTALANVLRDQSLWTEARTSYLKALELNPDNIEAHLQFEQLLIRAGHFREALVHGSRAAELDPLSWINQLYLALALYQTGDKDVAWRTINKAEVLANFRRSLVVRFKLRMALSDGLNDVARQSVRAFLDNPHQTEAMDLLLFGPLIEMLDDPDRARDYLRKLDTSTLRNIGADLFWLAYFEDFELADQWMEVALNQKGDYGEVDGTWLMFPPVEPLFSQPGFKLLMQRNRLESYWRAHGWPNFCRPIDEQDFECGMDAESMGN